MPAQGASDGDTPQAAAERGAAARAGNAAARNRVGRPTPAHPVRPRSVRAHTAVLTATCELLRAGGFPAATVDAVAERSGVSKATLYKHWPSRAAIAAEAFGIRMAACIPLPDTGSAVGDLREQVRRVSEFCAGPDGVVLAQLLAAGVTDSGGASHLRDFFLSGRRQAIAHLWQRALDRGEVRADVDADTAVDLLFGPLVFRLLSGHLPLTPEQANALTGAALRGLLRP